MKNYTELVSSVPAGHVLLELLFDAILKVFAVLKIKIECIYSKGYEGCLKILVLRQNSFFILQCLN